MAVARGGIPPETLQQIRDRIDITEVVSRYVTLSKTGQNHRGLCPFHSEKTPSFTVSQARQMFHCFGCGVGGDAFTFLMKKEGMGFLQAVAELGREANVTIPAHRGGGQGIEQTDNRKRLEEAHTTAASWFRGNLLDPRQGQEARTYLAGRDIDPNMIEEFGLGYALSSWDGLTTHLLKTGVSSDDMVRSGLVVEKEKAPSKGSRPGSRYYDRFRSRLMFPICNLRGQVIAFGGRVLEAEGVPKYLNSPETPLFSKGRCLYGLDRARETASRLNTLMMVEGYFDVITLYQAGIKNVVAPLGTALTKEHIDTIRRLATTVVLLFDGDSAGTAAVLRTLDLFVNSGITVKVMRLPRGEDPDTFVRTHGAEAFARLKDDATSLLDFAIERCMERSANGTVEERVRSVDDILRILQKTTNVIQREEYARQVAERLRIRQHVLIERYPALVTQQRGKNTEPTSKTGLLKGHVEERDLVALLLQGQLEADHVKEVCPEAFTIPAYRRIVEIGLRHVGEDGHIVLADVYEEAMSDPDAGPVVTELTLSDRHFDNVRDYIRGCLDALERKRLRTTLDELIARLRLAEQEQRTEEVSDLNTQIDHLRGKKACFTASSGTGQR